MCRCEIVGEILHGLPLIWARCKSGQQPCTTTTRSDLHLSLNPGATAGFLLPQNAELFKAPSPVERGLGRGFYNVNTKHLRCNYTSNYVPLLQNFKLSKFCSYISVPFTPFGGGDISAIMSPPTPPDALKSFFKKSCSAAHLFKHVLPICLPLDARGARVIRIFHVTAPVSGQDEVP